MSDANTMGERMLSGKVGTVEQTIQHIAIELTACGVRRGGILLVHSSLSSMGYVPGGAETVIRGLLEALGEEGTLLLPALSYETVHAQQPVFDIRRTPSCVGAITEHYRVRPGTLRSLHPTHSVCGVGPLAPTLLGEHHLDDTPCGAHSPFRKLRDMGGQILFLGCGLRPNTSMHGVEEVTHAPYLFGGMVTYRLICEDGSSLSYTCRRHAFVGWRQRYDRVRHLLASGTEIREGRVLQATIYLLEAQALWQRAAAAMRQEPFYFVEPASPA